MDLPLLGIGYLSGTRGNRADRAMSREIRLAAKPPVGVPRHSSLVLWPLGSLKESRNSDAGDVSVKIVQAYSSGGVRAVWAFSRSTPSATV